MSIVFSGTREFVACNHMRAYHLFRESINSQCPFEGYRCQSEDDFNVSFRCEWGKTILSSQLLVVSGSYFVLLLKEKGNKCKKMYV